MLSRAFRRSARASPLRCQPSGLGLPPLPLQGNKEPQPAVGAVIPREPRPREGARAEERQPEQGWTTLHARHPAPPSRPLAVAAPRRPLLGSGVVPREAARMTKHQRLVPGRGHGMRGSPGGWEAGQAATAPAREHKPHPQSLSLSLSPGRLIPSRSFRIGSQRRRLRWSV